jgi:hypothetical protein
MREAAGLDDALMARCYSGGRVALGAVFLVAPGTLRGWIGDDARRPGTRVLARAFGARDAALGLGALLALNRGAPARRWLQLAAAADAVDALASLASLRRLPARGAVVTAAMACLGAATGAHLAARVE